MKKFVGLILVSVLLISCFSCFTYADDGREYEYVNIDKLGNFDVDRRGNIGYGVYYKKNDKNINIDNNYLSDDDLDRLLEYFSDENLEYTGPEISEIVENTHPDYPSFGNFGFTTTDDVQYDILFDREKVLVRGVDYYFSEVAHFTVYQGWFKFKDGVYDEFMIFLEELEAKMLEQSEKNQQEYEANLENKIDVKDLKIIYSAQFSSEHFGNDMGWGICEYVREGQNSPVTLMYYDLFYNSDVMRLYTISDTVEENNTVSFDLARTVKFEEENTYGIEYDSDADWLYKYKIQVNVTEDMKAESATFLYKHNNSNTYMSEIIDMDTYKESGSLSSKFFSVKNNITSEENVSKIENFKILSSEKLTTNKSDMKNAEWGTCSYTSKLSGNVKAYYFYIPNEDVYLITSSAVRLGDTDALCFSGYAIIDDTEVFDYNKYRIQLDTKSNNGEIYYRYLHVSVNNKSQQVSIISVNGEELKPEEDKNVNAEEATKAEEPEKGENTDAENNEVSKDEKEIQDGDDKGISEGIIEDFADVPKTHWAYKEVSYFSQNKIVLGYGNGYFGVNDNITYEHFALLLNRLFDYNAENKESSPAVREDIIVSVVKALKTDVSDADESLIEKNFTDCSGLKAENRKYIAAAIESGLVVGYDGKLFADQKLTRAETVVLLYRAING